MIKKKNDRRVARTKRMIQDAFVLLLGEKSFEEITVNDLAERADINRGTFYLHYHDKFDLLEQCENEIIREMKNYLTEFEKHNPIEFFQTNGFTPPPFYVKLLEYIEHNATFINLLLNPKANSSFKNKMEEVLRDRFLQNIKKFSNKNTSVHLEYISVFVLNNFIGFVQHWLNTGMRTTPEETAAIMFKLMGFGTNGILKFVKS